MHTNQNTLQNVKMFYFQDEKGNSLAHKAPSDPACIRLCLTPIHRLRELYCLYSRESTSRVEFVNRQRGVVLNKLTNHEGFTLAAQMSTRCSCLLLTAYRIIPSAATTTTLGSRYAIILFYNILENVRKKIGVTFKSRDNTNSQRSPRVHNNYSSSLLQDNIGVQL